MADFGLGNRPILDSQGEQTNPTAGTVMADSGAVPFGGPYEARIIINASAAAQFQVQRRNTANGANVGAVVGLYVAAGQGAQFVLLYVLEANERLRVTMDDNLTGTGWASVQLEQRS